MAGMTQNVNVFFCLGVCIYSSVALKLESYVYENSTSLKQWDFKKFLYC